MKNIVLIGGGGQCKVIIDIINSMNKYQIVGIIDKNINENVFNIPIIGNDDLLEKLYNEGIEYAFICIGNLNIRNIIYNHIKNIGFKLPVLRHKTAIVSEWAYVGKGTCIMPGAIINAGTIIGENCIINTGAVIEHDCKIAFNSHISPNSSIAGGVSVGFNTHIGIGSTIIQGRTIGNNVTIGAGAVVINDIEDKSLAVGVPAKVIKVKMYVDR
jgi:UDP-perosamine 4-acetyltransferase